LVVCLHGILDQADAWHDVALQLADLGYRVLAPDLRGHGRSEHVGPGSSYELLDFVGDVDGLLRMVPGPLTLVGHSLGAAVAAVYAAVRRTHVRTLVLVENILAWDTASADIARRIGAHIDELDALTAHPVFFNVGAAADQLRLSTPSLPEVAALRLADRATEPCQGGVRWRWDPRLRSGGALDLFMPQYRDVVSRLEMPLTSVRGANSPLPDSRDDASRQLASKDFRELVLSGGHNLHLEAPVELAAIIAEAAAS
jgi:pimeloyl-ACP methyl ester carboxylesterase